ncbi:MAG: xanthine dehydrogenase family protein subunit M [Proteobacteria bacterium]|nr:MAG: xanthine dehydrogenase family protein subunit M [Pseudomonadota bacterium]
MHSFEYLRPSNAKDAFVKTKDSKKFVAGGTTLVDLMKLEVETPKVMIDLNQLPLKKIEEKNGEWSVGALVTNTQLANDKEIQARYNALSMAILAGASVQLRNKATTGGNLLQRTRCVYFRDITKPCNKRNPGSGCSAIEGHNRNLAIIGTSDQCIASNPSDMNVALAAFEAKINLQNGEASRVVDFADFHVLPGKTPHIETVLQDGELITGITLPKLPSGTTSTYLKLRDRASYEFALASAAVISTMKNGRVERIRFAMGGIGTKPWRVPSAEKMLEGSLPTRALLESAIQEFLKGAKAQTENGFKLELARLCLMKALKTATSGRAS